MALLLKILASAQENYLNAIKPVCSNEKSKTTPAQMQQV